MKINRLLALGVVLLITTSCSQNAPEAIQKKPNVLFLFADDLTYTAINAMGHPDVITPNLDKLVRGGTTFSHAYNMGGWNGAVCAASRAMMISGRSIWRADGFRQNWKAGKGYDQTWGRLMTNAGYQTFMSGKWHVDAPADSVFEVVKHIRPGMPKDHWPYQDMVKFFKDFDSETDDLAAAMPVGYHRPIDENDTTWSPSDPKWGGFWEGGKHWSEVLKEDALDFLQMAEADERPFFMYLAFNAPHDPRQSPQSFLDQYKVDEIALPENWLPTYPYKDGIGCGPDLRDEALAPFPRTAYSIKKNLQEYYALITHLDHQVGEILTALEASGEADNTFIVFTSDHGLGIGSHGLMGKQNMFDHSMRVPFMVVGPGVKAGQTIDDDIYLQDLMPTVLDWGGVAKPSYVEFNSLVPLLEGDDEGFGSYDAIYGAYIDLQRMIRKDQYKLVEYPKISKTLLFDLAKDPNEINDISDLPEHASLVVELKEALRAMEEGLDDPITGDWEVDGWQVN